MKKKPATKLFEKIYPGTLPAKIYLCLNYDRESFLKIVKSKFKIDEPENIKTDSAASVHIFSQDNDEMYILRMATWKYDVPHRALLVHELFHLTMEMTSALGMKYEKANEEPYAYTIQFLFTECYNAILKKIK